MTNKTTSDQNQRNQQRAGQRAGRRVGYVVAIIINAIGLYIVRNMLDWDISFVTSDFAQVEEIIARSLVATIIVNALFVFYDRRWFKGLGEALSQTVSIVATARLLGVFPFDFSGWDGPWEQVARLVLILALIGTAVSILVSVRNTVLGLRELGSNR
ncbi:MAG: hypothetical protein ACR2QO_18955 [Acidimicrobiales bacterium]